MKKYLCLALTLLSTQTFAFFCPTNFNQINMGDTLEQVIAVCGAPDSTNTTTTDTNVPQEWTYYVNQPGSKPSQSMQQIPTVKMTVAFTADGKASNISIDGLAYTTPVCNGNTIKVGDDMKMVKSACGDPSFVNKGQLPTGQAKEIKTTELKYTSNPPVTLTFIDGKLTSRK